MAKIILHYVVALVMIFPLFLSHTNATTPRKLGVRHNAVTSLPNIYARRLGSSQNRVTSLINTNEAIFRDLEVQNSPILGLSAHEVYTTTTRKLGTRQSGITCFKNTNCAISGGSSSEGGSRHLYTPISSSLAHADTVTPSILGSRQNAVTSLSNTNKATSGGSKDHDSPILSSLAHTNTINIPLVDPTIFTNEANARKHGARQNPIIITSLPNTNKVTNPGESGRSPTQTQFLLPRNPGPGHVYSPISSSSSHANAITPLILGSHQNTISSSSTHTNAITIPLVDPTIFTYEANARKHEDRQNPIIITSLPNTNEVANIGESELHFARFPQDPSIGYVSSIIN